MIYGGALGLIEAVGLGTAAAALDAAIKTADVRCIGVERVIGVDKIISVTISITGDVAAVKSSVEAGVAAGNAVGKIISSSVLARPHSDVKKLVSMFEKSRVEEPKEEEPVSEPVKEETSADATEESGAKKTKK